MTNEELEIELNKNSEQLWREYKEKLGNNPVMTINAPKGKLLINFGATFHPMMPHHPKSGINAIKSFVKEQQLKLC